MNDPPEWAGFLGYVFFCLFGILFFVHGLAMFCAGLTTAKSSLGQLAYSVVVCSVVMLQFYTIGYSLMFSGAETGGDASWSRFIGDFGAAFLHSVDYTDPLAMGQVLLMYGFSVVPACLLASAACQRGRFVPMLVFVCAWMTLVYCPVAHWCWHQNGWSFQLGALDYAGGTIIHITAGFGALVYSLVLGPRLTYARGREERPFSLPLVVSGTAHMLFGWIGFTGASQTDAPGSALLGVFNTLLSAATGGLGWMALDSHVGGSDELSLVSFCSGVVSGLVAITPGAGYVPSWAGMLLGLAGGLGCNLATRVKFYLGVDDPLDMFAVHGIGGVIGTLLTGVFALPEFRQPYQFWLQLLSAVTTAAYTLGCTLVIAVAIDSVPSLAMRIDPDREQLGSDASEHGESAMGSTPEIVNTHMDVPRRTNTGDLTRLRQANVNVSMQFGAYDQRLLQRLPLSYGTYSDAEDRH